MVFVSPLPPFYSIIAHLLHNLVHYKEVVQIIFLYLELLRSTPPQELAFREMESLSSIAWKFRETGQPSSTVKALSSTLHSLYPREKILSGGYSANVFDAELLKGGMEGLRSDNCRIFIGSQEPLAGREKWEKVEEYYGTEYSIESFKENHWPKVMYIEDAFSYLITDPFSFFSIGLPCCSS